jgi:hypothetical protein
MNAFSLTQIRYALFISQILYNYPDHLLRCEFTVGHKDFKFPCILLIVKNFRGVAGKQGFVIPSFPNLFNFKNLQSKLLKTRNNILLYCFVCFDIFSYFLT